MAHTGLTRGLGDLGTPVQAPGPPHWPFQLAQGLIEWAFPGEPCARSQEWSGPVCDRAALRPSSLPLSRITDPLWRSRARECEVHAPQPSSQQYVNQSGCVTRRTDPGRRGVSVSAWLRPVRDGGWSSVRTEEQQQARAWSCPDDKPCCVYTTASSDKPWCPKDTVQTRVTWRGRKGSRQGSGSPPGKPGSRCRGSVHALVLDTDPNKHETPIKGLDKPLAPPGCRSHGHRGHTWSPSRRCLSCWTTGVRRAWGGVQVGSLGARPLSHPPRPAEAPLRPQAVSHPPSFVLQLKSGSKMFMEQTYCF